MRSGLLVCLCLLVLGCGSIQDNRMQGLYQIDVGQTTKRWPVREDTNYVGRAMAQTFGTGLVEFRGDAFLYNSGGESFEDECKIIKRSKSFTLMDVIKPDGTTTRLKVQYTDDGFWAYDLSANPPIGFKFKRSTDDADP